MELQKLFGWFGGSGIEVTGKAFETMGYRPGKFFAGVAGATETGGGVLLAAGLLVPLAAAMVAGTMLNAALSAHLKNGFWLQNRGWEYTFVIGGSAAGLGFTGPGTYSLDHAAGLALSGVRWGDAALAAALVIGMATNAYRLRTLAAGGQPTSGEVRERPSPPRQ